MPTPSFTENTHRTTVVATIRALLGLLMPFWLLALAAGALGLASGATAIVLLGWISQALSAGATPFGLIALLGLIVLTLGAGFASEMGNTIIGQKVIARLRRDLCLQIVSAPQIQVERMTPQRLMAVLTGDIETLSAATLNLAPIAVAAATVTGGFIMLAWQSPLLFAIVGAMLLMSALVNAVARRTGIRRFEALRDTQENLFANLRTIVDGSKELRMNNERRRLLLDTQLTPAIAGLTRLNIQTRGLFGLADMSGSFLFFSAILLVLAIGDVSTAAGFILLLLYLRAPLEQLVAALPMLSRAQVALGRIVTLSRHLIPETQAASEPVAELAAFSEITLQSVGYSYPAPDRGTGFAVGPVDLTLRPGEIVFITGENGAGKSTMLKLLTGLYAPDQGTVMRDGQTVSDTTRNSYRHLFSTVYFDYHLFDDVLLPDGVDASEISHWLERLHLADKVSVVNGRLSTTRLSAGQRRRLALLQVLVERRPVVALDEWAAEQDPAFRRIFYTELLPELRRRGAAVVAITHDDRYFHAADRCIAVGASGARCSALHHAA